MRYCLNCTKVLLNRHKIKFCSNLCQLDYQYKNWVKLWRKGKINGGIGITVRTTSAHLRRFLLDKSNNKCSSCGWDRKHPITKIVPLEIDHIDGDAENNLEGNLRLLCPNCHALTPFYKNLNKGKGRKWRMRKYIKN